MKTQFIRGKRPKQPQAPLKNTQKTLKNAQKQPKNNPKRSKNHSKITQIYIKITLFLQPQPLPDFKKVQHENFTYRGVSSDKEIDEVIGSVIRT